MKATRFAAYAAAVIAVLAVLVVSGCGGGGGSKLNNTVTTHWYGSLDGVLTSPPNKALVDYPDVYDDDVPLNAWIEVYWPINYDPPRQFTVSLEKEQTPGNWGGVHTRYSAVNSDPANADWWFQPTSNFSPFTSYRIIIRAQGESPVIIYFATGDWYDTMTLSRSAASTTKAAGKYLPANPNDTSGEDAVTHTITAPAKK